MLTHHARIIVLIFLASLPLEGKASAPAELAAASGRNGVPEQNGASGAAKSSAKIVDRVLLIMADDLRADVLGCYGDDITRTPHLDRLASESMVFDAAYCQATWCAPSRTSMMRSRYLDKDGPTLGEVLRESGMTTARIGKIFHMRVPGDIIAGTNGNDIDACWTERFNSPGQEAHSPGHYACLNQDVFTGDLANRETTKMKHRPYVSVQLDNDGRRQPDYVSASKAIEWIGEHGDASYFLAVGLVRPHYPMVAPKAMFDHYPMEQMPLPISQTGDLDDIPDAGQSKSNSMATGLSEYPDNQRRMWSAYRASVEFADQQVGRMLEALESSGLGERTMVIFTSDHGYHLGEHTFWQKSNLHEDVARVPLIVRLPSVSSDIRAGRSSSLVELVDVMPTICEAVGVKIPESVQGKSLVPVLEDHDVELRTSALVTDGKGRTRHHLLRTDRWAYFRYQNGQRELYDMDADPHQFENLSEMPDFSETVEKLDKQLDQRLAW